MPKPSKKIILLVLVLVILGSVIYAAIIMSRKEIYTAKTAELNVVESAALAKDSDNDGLKDWEEQLWKTDPENPDTDGDATQDGLEIKQGRNPLVAGQNDKLDTDTITNKINTETENDLTDTDKFSRELFVKIIAAKNNNTPPTESDIQDFLNKTISQELQDQKMRSFTTADFKTTSVETAATLKSYGNEIAAILKEQPPEPLEYEMSIVDRAEKNNDPSELQKLKPLITQYQRIQSDLLQVSVPQSALAVHIELADSVSGMIYSITGLSNILTDPIKALPGVSAYGDNVERFPASIRAFKKYFDTKSVVFGPGDAGYNFFNAI
jgi:hypothetical protein